MRTMAKEDIHTLSYSRDSRGRSRPEPSSVEDIVGRTLAWDFFFNCLSS